MAEKTNIYTKIIERIFEKLYVPGKSEIHFVRNDLMLTAQELGVSLPKNLGDVLYSFRFRNALPQSIVKTAPEGLDWVIRSTGRSKYMFSLSKMPRIIPNPLLSETKIPDATPGIIKKYSLNDEQGLLAILRHNRLIDIFTGVTCFSLQNHLRTSIPEIGQVETDEIYVGIDKKGVHYILPVQAKGGKDQLGIIQIEQDFAMCSKKFPTLACCPIAAQFIDDNFIALFSFELSDNGVVICSEKHYRLVESADLSEDELSGYRIRPE